MAMRETKSSTTSSQSDSWAEFYQHQPNISSATTSTMFSISDASNTNTAANPTGDGGGGSVASSSHLSPDGRVSKPIRRRSRASRRTPTTLLNTDPANFRAMVQQFTGGSGGGSGGFTVPFIREASNLHFGQQILPNPNQNRVGIPPGAYYNHLQLQQQQQQQQQQQSLHPYQQRPYMFSDLMSNMSTGQGGFDMGTEGIAISIHAPPRPNQNSNSNGSNNNMF